MRNLRFTPAMMVILAAALCIPGDAAPPPEVSISVDPTEVTVGDIFVVTITIDVTDGIELDLPLDEAHLGAAEIRAVQRFDESRPNEGDRVTVLYDGTLWEVGEKGIVGPPGTWRPAEGEPRELERPTAAVTVRSVLPSGADDIRPLREPREIPLRAWHYLLAALPVLLLLALIGGVLLWRRRRITDPADSEAAVALTPVEEALNALHQLEDEDLVGQNMLKEHYVELSQILRRYIERRWRLSALEETTRMLSESMRGCGRISEDSYRHITEVLSRADLAKFAKHRPEDARARKDIDQVRRIVTRTGLREEAQEQVETEPDSEQALAS